MHKEVALEIHLLRQKLTKSIDEKAHFQFKIMHGSFENTRYFFDTELFF